MKVFVKNGFDSFCQGTSMHGFAELNNSKSNLWKVIWTLLIGAALGITFYQVSISTMQYLDQNTITTIEPATAEDLMTPPLKICYPHWLYWINWTRAYRMGFSKECILYALSSFTNIISSSKFSEKVAAEELIDKMSKHQLKTLSDLFKTISLEDPFQTRLNFSTVEFSNNDMPMIKMCHLISGEMIQNTMINTPSTRNTTKSSALTPSQSISFNIAKRYFNDLDGNFSQSEFNFYFFDWLVTQSTSGGYRRVEEYTGSMLPVTVYPNAYSTKDYIRVTSKDDVYDITIYLVITKYKSNSKRVVCKKELRWVTTNRTCKHSCKIQYTRYKTGPCGLYDAMLTKRDKLEQVILKNFIFFDEEVESSKTNVVNAILSAPNIDEDSSTEMDEARARSEYDRCTEECNSLIGCFTYKFTTYTVRRNSEFSLSNKTRITIECPNEKETLVMTEMDTQSWEGFVGNVGGLLGIWTGASILSLIQMIYLTCCNGNQKNCKINEKEVVSNEST